MHVATQLQRMTCPPWDTMLATTDRRDRLDTAIAQMAADSEYTPVVTRMGCLRGVSTLTAFALAVEIGHWHRLTGRSVGAYVGLVPSESSSGRSRAQEPITMTGYGHVRRLLVEAAWHHRTAYRPSVALRRRWDQASPAARARGHAGNRCLHARWQAFDERHERVTVANAAIARELAGWCWSLAVLDWRQTHVFEVLACARLPPRNGSWSGWCAGERARPVQTTRSPAHLFRRRGRLAGRPLGRGSTIGAIRSCRDPARSDGH